MESEWHIACTAGEQNEHGAGDFDDTGSQCNTLNCYETMSCVFPTDLVRSGAPVAPGSMTDCQPPQRLCQGIYDMTGNVWEWENACDGESGAEDQCAARGSSYSTSPTPCDFAVPRPLSDTSPIVGFRCCGDPADR
jgi:sulfatase modifying factor 1